MLQEDSNGDNSFEIVDKKNEVQLSKTSESTTASSISSSYSIPSPSVTGPGNLLSNIPPPSNLPDLSLWQAKGVSMPAPAPLPSNILPPSAPQTSQEVQYQQPQFNAAIPPSKGIQHGPQVQKTTEPQQSSGGLMNWMKDAVSTGGIFSRVAEKAKNSVDSLITTLDPQMSEYIYSSGDLVINVTSHDPNEIIPVREAVHSVLGRAWVNGVTVQIDEIKHQTLGFEDGVKRAREKVDDSIKTERIPTIGIENILVQQNDCWFDVNVLVLKDDLRHISLHTFTQGIIIPLELFLKEAEKEMPVYAKECESTEKLLSAYLKTRKDDWQESICGVTRRETIHLAAKSLLGLYKSKIAETKVV